MGVGAVLYAPHMRISSASCVCLVVLLLAGCGTPDGSERGACYGNGTCDTGLTCLSDLCVRSGDAGSPDAGLDAGDEAGTDAGDADAGFADAGMSDGGDARDAAGDDAAVSDAGETLDAADGDGGMWDAGEVVRDGGLTCEANVPSAPYGTRVTSKFRPLTLNQCDGTPYSIYNEDFCAVRFTVINIAAGWCNPSRLETAQFTALNAEYSVQGVRLLQVMFQDESYGAASGAYCQAWVDEFGLTNVELNDPTQSTQIYFPAGSLPATLIIDSTGTIVFREYGMTDGLVSLRASLDTLLAGP